MSLIMVTWHAHVDDRTCPICLALNGYTWGFEVGGDYGTSVATVQGSIRSFLVHPEFGVVWELSIGSKAHGHQRYNCRCHVTSEVDISDLRKRVTAIYEQVKASLI
jgi:hypothetical protein